MRFSRNGTKTLEHTTQEPFICHITIEFLLVENQTQRQARPSRHLFVCRRPLGRTADGEADADWSCHGSHGSAP